MQKILDKINWIPVSNDTIHNNLIRQIDKRAFMTLCYLLILCHDEDYTITTIKSIQHTMKIKDNSTIRKLLKLLEEKELIKFKKCEDIFKYKYTDNIEIIVLYKEYALSNGFERIPTDIFKKYIYKIGYNGWALFCALAVYNNYNEGYAYPTYIKLQENLKMSPNTLKKTILNLCKYELITLIHNNKVWMYYDINDNLIFRYENNRYIVNYMYYDELWINYVKVDIKKIKSKNAV